MHIHQAVFQKDTPAAPIVHFGWLDAKVCIRL